MKNLNKKIIAILAITFSLSNLAFATVKSDLVDSIESLESKYDTLKSESQEDLTTKVTALSTSYSNIFTNLGYEDKVIEYLESLGELDTNFKENLLEEYNTINSYITEEIASDTAKLATTKNTINFDDNITDTEKTAYTTTINNYTANYNDLESTIELKISALNTKYSALITSEKSKIQDIVEENLTGISDLDNFLEKYEALTEQVEEFEELYQEFTDTYLAYSSDLTALIDTKEEYYTDLLDETLTDIREANIENNSSLAANEGELKVYQNKLVNDFDLSLQDYIDNEYFALYSKTEVDRILENYDSITTKFIDSEGKIRSTAVISDANALEEIESNSADLEVINTAVKELMDESSTENTLENMKVKIENKIIDYYNDNYKSYTDDFKTKISEKVSFFNLQNTDGVIISELLTIKYENLYYRIISSSDYTDTKKENEIKSFVAYLKQYYALKNDLVDTKINSLVYELEVYVINKRLSQSKFSKYLSSKSDYQDQLSDIFESLKEELSEEDYETKLDTIEENVDALLDTSLGTKTEFIVLMVKLAIVKDRVS